MKTLLFLFILDFSGSMYQKMNGQEKYIVLRENVNAFSQSLNDDALSSDSGVLSFGLNPKKKCEDFTYNELATKSVPTTVNKYLPGAFAKTPLGESLRRATELTIEKKIKKLIIFSDISGKDDLCNQDPCEALVKANDKLKIANYTMNIKFIWISKKEDDPVLACFRNNKLSNINIDFSRIGDAFDMQDAFQDAANASGGGISLQTVKSPWGIIYVKGAPANAKFNAEAQTRGVDNKGRNKWLGSYKNQLKGGGYFLTTNYPGTKKIEVFVYPDQEKEVYWSDFFKDPRSKLNYSHSTISVMLNPGAQTKESHRTVSSILLEGLIEDVAKKDIKIPFGDWVAEPLSPPWLKDFGSKPIISLKPQSLVKVNFADLFDLEWLTNPDAERPWVLAVMAPPTKEDEEEAAAEPVSGTLATEAVSETLNLPPTRYVEDEKRYYIQPGVLVVPMVKGAKVRWLKPEEVPSSVNQDK